MKIVHNRLLGGWFIVRGAHQTPISGRFDSKEQAQAHLNRQNAPKLRTGQSGTSSGYRCSVVRHYEGNMYEFRFASGTACISAHDFIPDPTPTRGIRMSGSPFARGY